MVRIGHGQILIFLVPILLGVSTGITGFYPLAALAMISLFFILGFMPSIRGSRQVYQFFFSFLTCLPINIRVSIDLFNLLIVGETGTILVICTVAVFSFILISVEEIILGIVTYLIWGEQDNSLFAEQEKNSEREFERRYRTKREQEIVSLMRKRYENSEHQDEH